MPEYQGDNKRIAKNTLFLYIRMFFVLLANLYISRVLLQTFGIVDYGVYTVVGGLVSLFGFFNTTLASTLQRYYNYEGTHHQEKGIKEVFSTGCIINLFMAGAMFILLESLGQWFLNYYLVIPAERMPAARILFHTSTLSLAFIILQIPALGLILAKEKMGFYSIVSIIDILLKLVSAIALTYISTEHISTYAYLLLGIAVFNFLLYHTYAKWSFSYISISLKLNKALAKSLLSFTGWNLMGTLAYMLKGQGVSLLLNNFFGPVVNSARGISMQVSNAIGYFSSNISLAFAPQISNAVAAQQISRAQNLMFTESKICFALILIIATPICLEMDIILKLWLGNNIPLNTNIFSILMLIDTLICTLNTPCTQITMATGNIKFYQIASGIVNICLIPVCYVFLSFGYSATSSFIITVIFSIINQIVCLFFTSKAFYIDFSKYTFNVILPCLTVACIIPVSSICVEQYMTPSIGRLLLICIVNLVVAIPVCYYLMLKKAERMIIAQYAREKIQHYLKYVH